MVTEYSGESDSASFGALSRGMGYPEGMTSALTLTPPERATLDAMRARHPKAYLRERAAALLKIAAGMSPRQVALHGLLRPRDPSAVNRWLTAYQTHGLGGLYVRPSRRAFSP